MVVVVELAAGTEKAVEVRVESGVVVAAESYQDTPSAAVTNPHLLPDNQFAAAAGRMDAGQESRWAVERDHLEENRVVGKSGFDLGNQSAEGIDTLADPGPIATWQVYEKK